MAFESEFALVCVSASLYLAEPFPSAETDEEWDVVGC